jgi:integrase
MLTLVHRFQESSEFLHKISKRTRDDYIKHFREIETAFGDLPLKALDETGARSEFLAWRDQLAKRSLRQADYMFSTLARILAWACNRGLIRTNPCTKVGRLYHGTRVDKIWSEEDFAAFLRTAPPNLALAAQLAISTGQRQGDLLRAGWTAYDGSTIKLRQRKTGVHVSIPVAAVLKQVLDATPRRSPLILTNADGRPFSESGFRTAWRAAAKRAGIQGLRNLRHHRTPTE